MKQRLDREVIPMRIAKEFRDGDVVNVGIGLTGLVSSHVLPNIRVTFHAENGVIGYGEVLREESERFDYNLLNAATQFVAPLPGMCFVDIGEAFDAIRVGRVDISVLGALQVSEKGDLANWSADPKGRTAGIGGAMDMPIGVKKVIIGMQHVEKSGKPKIVNKCSLPLTAEECVDLIVSDVAVIEVTRDGLLLKEVAPKWSPEEVQAITEPRLMIAPDLKEMEL